MIAGLPDAFDPATLPISARIAQVVLAGTAVAWTAARTVNARADMMLVVEMVHRDLTGDVRAGRLPALDPQVVQLERTLSAARRLSPAAIAQQAVRRGEWWEPAGQAETSLSAEQQYRLDRHLEQLEAAATAYRLSTRPWWRFTPSAAPRHFHGNQRPRTLHASANQRRPLSRKVTREAPADPGRPPIVLPTSGVPAPRVWERNLLFDGAVGGTEPAAEPSLTPLLGESPAPAVESTPLTRSITVAISHSRGIDPADTQQINPETGQHIDLGRSGLDDVLQR